MTSEIVQDIHLPIYNEITRIRAEFLEKGGVNDEIHNCVKEFLYQRKNIMEKKETETMVASMTTIDHRQRVSVFTKRIHDLYAVKVL